MTGEIFKADTFKTEAEPFIIDTPLDGVFVIKRPRFEDSRGSFQEIVRIPDINKHIKETRIWQSQISVSGKNVLRGIHAEPRDKIITPILGRLASVIVDLRPDSKTFKKWVRIDFNAVVGSGYSTLFVPDGCGNSLCVYQNEGDEGDGSVIYHYTYSDVYDPKWSGSGVRYNDPTLNIKWPIDNPILSERDKDLPILADFINKFR